MTARLSPIEIPENLPPDIQGVLKVMKQNIEVLAGFTGDKKDRAIRFGEALVADLDTLTAAYSAVAPTKVEFDKVIDDLTAFRDRFNYLVALLRGDTVGG